MNGIGLKIEDNSFDSLFDDPNVSVIFSANQHPRPTNLRHFEKDRKKNGCRTVERIYT